ncbi:MAG: arylsulfatase [Gemmataceae bacterium]|nr:arylsulfatase [Gemmataceae bacterium]
MGAWLLAAVLASGPAAPPNVVVILADDIGYGDLGCYGSTVIPTPNCDRLAREGRRFTDAHSPSSYCTPSRYALMTGQYAFRHAPGSGVLSGVAPLAIPTDRDTLPKVLQRAGYRTAVVGKWHLGLGAGPATDYNGAIEPGPRDVGFADSFIIPATGDRVPCVFVRNQHVVGYDPADPIRVSYGKPVGEEPTGASHPQMLTTRPSVGHNDTIINGVSRIGFMTGGQRARWKDEDIADTITGRAVEFIEAHRHEPFFLYFATHDAHVPRLPHPRFRGKSGQGQRGDAIVEFDWSVGQILSTLDKYKIADNTLVIVTSDNGGVMDDGYQDGTATDASGHKCNGPLRAAKGSLHEGGHRVPMLVRWPGHVPAGSVSGALVSHVDWPATIPALVRPGKTADSWPDGVDVSSAYTADGSGRDSLVHHTNGPNGALAIRQGPWKLIPGSPAIGKKAAVEPRLFHLTDDLAESTNLAKKHPEQVARLETLLKNSVGRK